MSTITTTSGTVTEEFDMDVDTEDITLSTDPWDRLADAFAAGDACPSCILADRGPLGIECLALVPEHCPVVNGGSIANSLRRQAS